MVDIKEYCTELLSKPVLPITWEWLAGFFQAEGHFGENQTLGENGKWYPHRSLEIAQKDPEVLSLVSTFLEKNSISNKVAPNGTRVNISVDKENIKNFFTPIIPYLRGTKGDTINKILLKNSIDLSPFLGTMKLDWDFITGFWEGDGSFGGQVNNRYISFGQKDRVILDLISEFIGRGTLEVTGSSKNRYEVWQLRISTRKDILLDIQKFGDRISKLMLKYCRASRRRIELAIYSYNEEPLLLGKSSHTAQVTMNAP